MWRALPRRASRRAKLPFRTPRDTSARMRKRDFDPRKSRKGRPDFGRPDRPNRRPDHRADEPRREQRQEKGQAQRHERGRERPEGGERAWQRDKAGQDRPFNKKKPWRPQPRDRDGPVI